MKLSPKITWLTGAAAMLVVALLFFIAVVAVTGVQCCRSSAEERAVEAQSRVRSHNEIAQNASRNAIDVYEVALRCPLASGLGCGSESKPVMKRLENTDAVEGVWLNHAGTKLAVLWKEDAGSERRAQSLASAFSASPPPTVLSGEERQDVLEDFLSSIGWYRTVALDELSAEEANVVAADWVNRITKIIPLPRKMRASLECALADRMRQRFVND